MLESKGAALMAAVSVDFVGMFTYVKRVEGMELRSK